MVVSASRRRFIHCQLLVGAGAIGCPAILLRAQPTKVPDAGGRLDKFFNLSRNLLAPLPINTHLDRRVAVRLLAILNRKYPDFSRQLDQMNEDPSQSERESETARHIVRAWYTGVIDGKLVTFERALMYRVVSDVLPVRTYCDGRPGDWASLPSSGNRGV